MHPLIQHAPSPDHPGWWTWDVSGPERYNATIGKLLVRAEGPNRARCRMFPETYQSNLGGVVHGGAILTFIDMALFAGGRLAGISDIAYSVTLDLSCQFVDVGRLGEPLDCAVELIRETGRLAFLRGLVEQEGRAVASWTGTLRKGGERR
jgi:acyl-coenzyme A thioesterase PaaI-like protein